MVDLKAAPFCLGDEEIGWVEETQSTMTLEEKIGQLFCPIGFTDNEAVLGAMVKEKHIGGMLFRAMEGEKVQRIHRFLQREAKVPMILCANVETGGDGIATDGTGFAEQMQVAATGDAENARTLGRIAAVEGAAVGLNLALGPIADMDLNYYNPITNVRTYGSDAGTVREMAVACHRGLREGGLFATAKHFPGDGVDDRDQHLLTSVNRLGREEWDKSFGNVYSALIEDGVLAVMAGHIALPAYQTDEDLKVSGMPLPASLSKDLLQGLLRQKLGFNGLVVTDATPMVGFCSAMERRRAVPYSIEAGCDVFLFNKDLDEDFGYMMEGYNAGVLSEQRLEDAVRRILGVKAAMGLHKKQQEGTLVPPKEALRVLGCKEHAEQARFCADNAITLVKDTTKLLPVAAETHRRVFLEVLGGCPSNERVEQTFVRLLEKEGFEVSCYRPENFETLDSRVEHFRNSYDLVLYVGNVETLSNQTVSRINWNTLFGQGDNVPWFVCEVPTVFVSVGNPYHLLDAPMVSCYVNAYYNSDIVLETVVDKLVGRSVFKGTSPVDAFCGRAELRLSPARK